MNHRISLFIIGTCILWASIGCENSMEVGTMIQIAGTWNEYQNDTIKSRLIIGNTQGDSMIKDGSPLNSVAQQLNGLDYSMQMVGINNAAGYALIRYRKNLQDPNLENTYNILKWSDLTSNSVVLWEGCKWLIEEGHCAYLPSANVASFIVDDPAYFERSALLMRNE